MLYFSCKEERLWPIVWRLKYKSINQSLSMTSSQTAWLYLRLLKGIATYYSYNRPAGFCATFYNSVITVYSAASGSPHDAASICLVCMYMHYIFAVPFVVHLLVTGSLFVPSLWLSDILSLLAQLALMWGFTAFWKWRLLSATSDLHNVLFNIRNL